MKDHHVSISIILVMALGSNTHAQEMAAPPMVVIDQNEKRVVEPPPHGKIGLSTAYRITDGIAGRTMEFRRRTLHKDAAIGIHPINHDEVYYVLSGKGIVQSDGETKTLTAGMAAYLYRGANVGIRQIGDHPLDIIISYPVVGKP
jgi:mannose-6-phosphate isomerase-like protein (cupin superfamily)